jgi:hypothetical protein
MGKAVPSLFLPFAELLDRERLKDFFFAEHDRIPTGNLIW